MDETDGLPQPARRRAILTIAIAVAISVLSTAIANIALPTIAQELHASPSASIWVVNAYQLAVTVSLLPLASLGDIYGYRRVYWGGLLVFTLASGACATANSLDALTLARIVQGFGAAGIMSVNIALVRFIYPYAMIGRGTGTVALIVATAAAAGPTVASAILAVASWQWLFVVNVPLGLLALVIAARSLPHTPRAPHRFDGISAVLNAITFGLLITAIDGIGQGSRPAATAAEFAGAVVFGALLVRRQAERPSPMLPVDLLRLPVFALSVVT